MIDYFLSKYGLTEKELSFYKAAYENNQYIECSMESIEQSLSQPLFKEEISIDKLFLDLIPYQFSGIENYKIGFGQCATDLIKDVFKKHCSDDTLIITSNMEHPNVNKWLKEYKNVYKIISTNHIMISDELISKIKSSKNIFVYCIGTTCSNGFIVPNSIFKKLKNLFETYNKEYIFALDTIQELFLTPRDYSMFDYIFGTGHVYAPDFNMGFCLSRQKQIGTLYENIFDLYKLIQIYLKRESFIRMFNQIIKDHFDYLVGTSIQIQSGSFHLISIGDTVGTLKPLIKENEITSSLGHYNISFRCSDCLYKPDETKKLIRNIDKLLSVMGFKEN